MAKKWINPIKKGRYTVAEYDAAIEREKKVLKTCEPGGEAERHFKDSIEFLTDMRNKERG
jgi:hypothetical protein